ncbi:MAG: amidase [bacterium]
MAIADETALLDATSQAQLVRSKELTPLELVDAAIERIERLNPEINAVVTKLFEQARDLARAPLPQGPFTGVPFLLKDLLAALAGVGLTMGSRLMMNFSPPQDSELVSRLKRAGLIILGKTNTPELGILPTTEPRLFGPTKNPWDPTRTPGGSSGGSAAAVASRMVPMAHGNDGGGSIRIPASCCGLFGLKPTRARNPLGPNFGDLMGGLVVEHALTLSVRDSAALLDATSGPDVGDPYWAPPNPRPFLHDVGADPGRLKIGFTTRTPGGHLVHPDCLAAVMDAARLCEELGHVVEEASPTLDAELTNGAFMVVWSSGCASTLEGIARLTGRQPSPEHVEPTTWSLYEIGKNQSAANYLLAVQLLQSMSRKVAQFFQKFDLWLTPTLFEPPLPLGSFEPSKQDPLLALRKAAQFVPFTPICNMTGQPAMSVPLYWNAQGHPIGTHFVARFGEESTLFRLGAQLEAARPWINKRPPLSFPSPCP